MSAVLYVQIIRYANHSSSFPLEAEVQSGRGKAPQKDLLKQNLR